METKEIVRQIELRLVELGMKKGDFYKLTGVSSSSFSQWNTGIAQPSRDALHRIDLVLGTSFELSQQSDNIFDKIQMLQLCSTKKETVEASMLLRFFLVFSMVCGFLFQFFKITFLTIKN